MRKEFEIGIRFENNTEYYASKDVYHVYPKDTVEVCEDRYVALRAHDTKEFDAFVFLKGKKNITLDFGGATLVMHGKIQPFLIDSCENVTIKNCNVTYERPAYTEAMIVEADKDFVRLKLNEKCTCYIEDEKLIPYGENWENHRLNYNGHFHQVFDTDTRKGCGLHLGAIGSEIIMERDRPYTVRHFKASKDGEDILLKGDVPEFYKEGRTLVITHETRSLASVFMIDSKNVSIINYRILSGWGMGIYSYRTENIYIDTLVLTCDEKTHFIVTNAADVIHTFGTSGEFVIKNCVFEGMIDDAINIHSNFRTVNYVCGNEIHADLASCEKQAADLYRVGDVIAVYKGKTMEEAARYTITEIRDVDESAKIYIVDRDAGDHKNGDLIECITANCDVTIESCVIGKANSHIRLQTRGKIEMRNCESELPILLSGDASYWFESGPVTDLTIENCRFLDERAQICIVSEIYPNENEPYYHKNIKVINCEFDTDVPLWGGYADGIVFKGNVNSKGKSMKIILTNCGTVEVDEVEVENKKEVKTELNLN